MKEKDKAKTKKNRKTRNKTSKRVLDMWNDPATVWGKNKPLETFWKGLASGNYVVVVYKNGTHESIRMPNPSTQKSTKLYNDFEEDEEIEAVLSSNSSQDAYEMYLYPKAKHSSVESVIQKYKKYFKRMDPAYKLMVPM